MLQPRTYPELMGKALVFEPEPFITMVDDDNPWVEGLFLVLSVGVLVGIAQFIGGLLTTASLPATDALLEAVIQNWQQIFMSSTLNPTQVEEALRQAGTTFFASYGLAGTWSRLLVILLVPLGLLCQWLFFGLVTFGAARVAGGQGTLNQTLGATALMVAPQILALTAIVPFASVGWLLLLTWSTLIAYRAVEAAHELSWKRSALIALAPLLLLLIVSLVFAGVVSVALSWDGGL